MAMTIQNDGSAMLTLGEITKNQNALSKNLKKLASGQKISGAGDDASGYAISEKMRVRLRALEQDTRNTQTGASLLRVAEGGVQSIIEELRTLKELSLNAANDTNTDLDRATIQKEFDQRRANIDNIAVETNYNGKRLLDGSFRCTIEGTVHRELIYTDTQTSTVTGSPVHTMDTQTSTTRSDPAVTTTSTSSTVRSDTMPSTGTTVVGPIITTTPGSATTDTTGPTTTTNTTTDSATTQESADGKMTETITTTNTTAEITESPTIVTEPSTETAVTTTTTVSATPVGVPIEPKTLAKGTTTITESGVYQFASDYTGTLTIKAANVTLIGSSSTLNNVNIVDNGVEDLYLKNVNISNTNSNSAIAFDSSASNKLHLLGNNSIVTTQPGNNAVIEAGGGLTFVGNGTLSVTHTTNGLWTALIGSGANSSCGDISIGEGVTLELRKSGMCQGGTGLGSGVAGSCGKISIGTGAKVSAYWEGTGNSFWTGIGAGGNGTCEGIVIYAGAEVYADGRRGAAIGSNSIGNEDGTGHCGNITIYSDAEVTAVQTYTGSTANGAAIGTGNRRSQCETITIYKDAIVNTTGVIGKGGNETTSSGPVNRPDTRNATAKTWEDDTDPTAATTTKYDVTTAVETKTAVTEVTKKTTTTERDTTTTTETIVTTNIYSETPVADTAGTPLAVHHGTKANIALNIFLEDMRTRALKGDIPSVEDTERLSKLSGAEAAELQAILDEAKDKTLDDARVTTRHNATVAITIVDGAIQYALDQATTIGAYLSRLDFTESNLVTATENTQQSESTIRDADMAKEMAEYTKNNVLLQASESMLAQANQNTSTVLGLLQ